MTIVDQPVIEKEKITQPLTFEQAKSMVDIYVDSTTSQVVFILLLWNIIDDLLLEEDFSDDFFAKFDYYYEEAIKSKNKSILLIFDEIIHIFWQKNQNLQFWNTEFKNESEKILRYRNMLENLKNNEVKKIVNSNEIPKIINERFNWQRFFYLWFDVEIELNWAEWKNINLFFLDLILDNILSNYHRYGKNWTLKIVFKEDSFELEFSNEIREFNQEVYDKFNSDFSWDNEIKFSIKFYENLWNIEWYNEWFNSKKYLIDDFENIEWYTLLFAEFFDKFFSKYCWNTSIRKKDFIDISKALYNDKKKSFIIYRDSFIKRRWNLDNFDKNLFSIIISNSFSYIYYNWNKPQWTWKWNWIIGQTVKEIFWGEMVIEKDWANYSFKASWLKYH